MVAPTPADTLAGISSALVSYNRPLILGGIFLVSLLVTLYLPRRSIARSLLVPLGVTFIVAVYLVVTYLAGLRY